MLEGVVIERTRLFDKLSVEAQEKLLDRLTEATSSKAVEAVIEQGQLNEIRLHIIGKVGSRKSAGVIAGSARTRRAGECWRLSRQGSSNSSGRINLSRQASEGEVSPRSDGERTLSIRLASIWHGHANEWQRRRDAEFLPELLLRASRIWRSLQSSDTLWRARFR